MDSQLNKNPTFVKAKVLNLLGNRIVLVEQNGRLRKIYHHQLRRIIERNRDLANGKRTESTQPYWWDISNKGQEVNIQKPASLRRSERTRGTPEHFYCEEY